MVLDAALALKDDHVVRARIVHGLETLPLPAELGREANQLGRGGTKKRPRNRFEMGQIMVFGSQQRPRGARSGLWPGNQGQKIASGGKWGYIASQPKGKTEIPDKIARIATCFGTCAGQI